MLCNLNQIAIRRPLFHSRYLRRKATFLIDRWNTVLSTNLYEYWVPIVLCMTEEGQRNTLLRSDQVSFFALIQELCLQRGT